MLRIIKGIYRNTQNEIITREGIKDRFKTEKSLKQGCLMSTTLFNAYIEDLDEDWENWIKKGVKSKGKIMKVK